MYLYLFHLHSEGGFCFLLPRTQSQRPPRVGEGTLPGTRPLPVRTEAGMVLRNAQQLASLARTTLDTQKSRRL